MLVRHGLILAFQPVPPNQQLWPTLPVGPVLVFQKLLAHEDHRHAGCGEQNPCGDFRPAPRVPGTCVDRIGQRGDARLAISMIKIKQVVILNTLKYTPSTRIFVGQVQCIAYFIEVHEGTPAARRLRDRSAQVIPQRVAVAQVKAHSFGGTRHTFPALAAPILGNLYGARFHKAQCI